MGSRLLKYLQENEGQGSLGRPLALPTVCHGIISSFKEYFSPRASKTDKSRNQRINCYSQRKSTFPVFFGGGEEKKCKNPPQRSRHLRGKKALINAACTPHRLNIATHFSTGLKKKKTSPSLRYEPVFFSPLSGIFSNGLFCKY